MLNLELFFLGKLRKHREFIISPKLSFQQRSFWDSWFNRCHVDNKLTPSPTVRIVVTPTQTT